MERILSGRGKTGSGRLLHKAGESAPVVVLASDDHPAGNYSLLKLSS